MDASFAADGDVLHAVGVLAEEGQVIALCEPAAFCRGSPLCGDHGVGEHGAGHIGDQELLAVFYLAAKIKLGAGAANDQALPIGCAGKPGRRLGLGPAVGHGIALPRTSKRAT